MTAGTAPVSALRSAGDSASPAVVFDRVSFAFDEHVVLRDISFSVPKGSMSILLGASGAGKSVLLKLTLGLLRPDAGAILVNGQRVDLMRHGEGAPASTMEYLFIELFNWGKENSFSRFNLGMAPLAGLQNRTLAPLWNRAGALLYRHGEYFYNFRGLRQYKQKFDPIWEPRYFASPAGLALPRILSNTAALIAGGLKGVVTR